MKSCHCCGLVQNVPSLPEGAKAVCRRCRTPLPLIPAEERSNALSAAVSLAALILFVPAITLPFLRIEQFGHTQENSLIGGVVALLAHGDWFVAVTVFAFSIVLPPVKLIALLVLGTIPGRLRSGIRAGTLRAVEHLGRWGMLDVLLVAVLLAFIKLGDMVDFAAGPGVVAFGAFVLLSLLAAYFFDPHALWDEGPMKEENRPTESSDNPNQLPRNDAEQQPPADNPAPEAQPLPSARLVPKRRIGWVWLLPIAALVGVGVLGYQAWQQHGTTISVTFAEGHGLKPGDQLRYRGTVAGKVERLAFTDGLDAVRADVQLQPGTEDLAREGSRFWIVRPELALTGVRGLETFVGANYLAVLPGPTDAPRQYHFIGLEQAPLLDVRESGGLNIVLQAADASGLGVGSPVYFRQLRVGGVRKMALASDGSAVEVHAYVRPAFRQLIVPQTRFWKTGGLKIEAGWEGVSLELAAAQTLLQTGVSLAVPPGSHETVDPGHRFRLYEEPDETWLQWRPSLGNGTVPANLPQPTWAILKWTDPGYLYNTQEKRSGWVLLTGRYIIGPQTLLAAPEGAKADSAQLTLADRRLKPPAETAPAGAGLARIEADVDESPLTPVTLREATNSEDVLVVAEDKQRSMFVSAARLTQEDGFWAIDSEVPLDPAWHGAPAVAVADGAVIGLLLLDEEVPRIGLYREPEAMPQEQPESADEEAPPGPQDDTDAQS
jgi:hypothetical protein